MLTATVRVLMRCVTARIGRACLVYFTSVICVFPCPSPHAGAVQRQSDNADIDGDRQRADVVQDSA